MGFVLGGRPVSLSAQGLAAAYPVRTSRVVVLLHGVASTENVWRFPEGGDYGSRLAQDAGFTPFYLRYNSGLPIADNGARFAQLLQALLDNYGERIEEVVLLGYSMEACCSAQCLPLRDGAAAGLAAARAPHRLRRHAARRGARRAAGPRGGQVAGCDRRPLHAADRRAGQLAQRGRQRPGNADLRHEDRAQQGERLSLRDARHPVPLLPSIQHYLIAGQLLATPVLDTWFGDSLVPVHSATAKHMRAEHALLLPDAHVKVLPGLSHVALAHSEATYAQIRSVVRGQDMNEIKRWRGLKRLLQDAVVHGATAIEQVHLKTAERPFEILKRIPPLEASVSMYARSTTRWCPRPMAACVR